MTLFLPLCAKKKKGITNKMILYVHQTHLNVFINIYLSQKKMIYWKIAFFNQRGSLIRSILQFCFLSRYYILNIFFFTCKKPRLHWNFVCRSAIFFYFIFCWNFKFTNQQKRYYKYEKNNQNKGLNSADVKKREG